MDRGHEAATRAKDVARAATHLASEAAALARVFADHGPAADACFAASEASVRAADALFSMEREGFDDIDRAVHAALVSLEAASAAVAATRAALDAALLLTRDPNPGRQES
ncbi:MAG TPA: hypothetical protein VM370_13080 [Candidatus Thermoplasmatota archaeon]|nr:hypothetical protein [Candidatus Thermoplasmatota archaeon]